MGALDTAGKLRRAPGLQSPRFTLRVSRSDALAYGSFSGWDIPTRSVSEGSQSHRIRRRSHSWRLRQKTAALGRCRHATRFFLAEDPVAVAGDERIAGVA